MNDTEFEKQRQRVFSIAQEWQRALGLQWWEITYVWHREQIERSDKDRASDVRVFARTQTQWEYCTASIDINLCECTEQNDEDVARMIVHEFMHIFINELQHTTDDWHAHEERVCSTLAKAFFWLLESNIVASKCKKCPSEGPPIALHGKDGQIEYVRTLRPE